MQSLKDVLFSEWSDAPPEAKYTYLKLIKQQYEKGRLEPGTESLVKSTGVNKKTLGKSIEVLLNKGLVTKTQVEPKSIDRGRKKTAIAFNDHRGSQWNNFDQRIETILDACDEYRIDKDRKLQASQKLLITLLAARADDFGIVSDTTQSQLRVWTGTTSTRLKSIIKTLSSLGLIINVIPGLSGAKLFGKKTSIYVLNPRHPLFSKKHPFYTIKLEQIGIGMSPGAELYSKCYSRRQIPNLDEYITEYFEFNGFFEIPTSILPMFADKPVGACSAYFQEQIDVIVSGLLSQNHLTEEQLKEWSLDSRFFEQLFLKILPSSKKADSSNETQSSHISDKTKVLTDNYSPTDELKVEVEKISRLLYTRIKSLLHCVYGDDTQALEHRIVSLNQLTTDDRLLQIVSIPKSMKTINAKIKTENTVFYNAREGFSIVD